MTDNQRHTNYIATSKPVSLHTSQPFKKKESFFAYAQMTFFGYIILTLRSLIMVLNKEIIEEFAAGNVK